MVVDVIHILPVIDVIVKQNGMVIPIFMSHMVERTSLDHPVISATGIISQ